jgi:hypothetical protein
MDERHWRCLDPKLVQKWEKGHVRWPHTTYRAALRSLLDATDDARLGFFPPVATPVVIEILSDMERRTILRGGAAVGGLAALSPGAKLAAALESVDPAPIPLRVGMGDVERIHGASAAFRDLDFTRGGGFALTGAMAQLRWATRLLDAQHPERLKAPLFGAVGGMANTVGFAAFDAGRLDAAKRALNVGLACADEADDPGLRASILVDLASVALWTDRPQEAAALMDHVDADRLTSTERSLVWCTRARTVALRGDEQATLAAIGQADEELSHAEPDDSPYEAQPFWRAGRTSWLDWYNPTMHEGDVGHVLHDLVVFGGVDRTSASERLRVAVDGYTDEVARARAHALVRLATLHMATGEPDEAAGVGLRALEASGPIESVRSTEYLRTLHRVSADYASRPAVAELRAHTADMLIA